MLEEQASRTAQRVATHRAAHQLLDQPKVFEDPLAVAILGKEQASAIEADPRSTETSPISPRLRAFTAARSRFAEDELAQAVEQGVRQYVVLGAGLDTFAYRNPYEQGTLKVYEVDHPATQQWKRGRLEEAGVKLPESLVFAPLDFNQHSLSEGLLAAGHDPDQPTFFSWLGVTPYLRPEAVRQTLTDIATYPEGGGVVLDYAVAPELLDEQSRMIYEILSGWSRDNGEPWLAPFAPEVIGRMLGELGFGRIEDLGPEEINARYFAGRADGLAVGSLYRLVSATF